MTRAAVKIRITEIIEDLQSALEERQAISDNPAQAPGVREDQGRILSLDICQRSSS